MTREYTVLFDYQEFCELLDHIQVLRSLASENKSAAPMYREKIKQICERVERDFSDSHHFFSGWVFEWRQESNLRVSDSESTPRAWIADIPKRFGAIL